MLKKILPPFIYESLTSLYKKLNKNEFIYWEGNYSDWTKASQQCKGYDASEVLEKIKQSALKVKNGEAAFERDGALFYDQEYSWELLACVLKVAAEYKGNLSVIDFGGSLGSTYIQNKKMLEGLNSLTWCVIEQKNFVESGKSLFESEVLKFEYSIEDAIRKYQPNVLILASVLQYLPNPYEWLQKFMQQRFPYIIIERSPYIDGGNDRLTIQHIPEKINKGSYPSWFFSKQQFMQFILTDYELITTYPLNDNANIQSEFKGFFLKLK